LCLRGYSHFQGPAFLRDIYILRRAIKFKEISIYLKLLSGVNFFGNAVIFCGFLKINELYYELFKNDLQKSRRDTENQIIMLLHN
jgi:hypothetical protein